MALRGQHHLLLQELHEVADCFAKPQVSHAVRLQKSTQLRACIERVQSVCGELHETKAGQRQLHERAASAERLQRELDTTTARLKDQKERADAAQAKLLELYSSSAPDAQQLARQVSELEEALRRKTTELERGAGQQALRAQVEGLQRELDKRAEELRDAQAQATSTQKQLWQARDAFGKLNTEHETEAARHQHEVERLRQQIIALERQAAMGSHHKPPQPQKHEQPTGVSHARSASAGLDSPRVSVAVGGSPMEEVEEALAPDAARYRRQLNLERREHARTREERDQARQVAEGRTAELRRTQVILDGVKNDYATLAATGSELQAELERRSTQAAHLSRELDIMRDRLASKDAALRDARGRASQDFGSAIYIGQGGHRGPKSATADLALAETERQLAQMAREKAELMTQMDKMRANNRTLAANMANATKHGSLLQAKIQGILGREAQAHKRNDTLVAALKKAGAPIPFGTVLAPDELAEYAYDQQVFRSPLPELFSPEVETLLTSPTKRSSGATRGFDFPSPRDSGVGAELEATKRLADEFTILQGEADATVARLNQVDSEAGRLGSDDDRLKRMQAEKTIALALLLGRMGKMHELTKQLEASRGGLQASKAVGGTADGLGLEEARERLLAADEVCDTLQGQLVQMESVLGGLSSENDALRQELDSRQGELGELRAQVKGMLGDLDGLVVENTELRAALTRSTGEKIVTQAMLLALKGRFQATQAALADAQTALAEVTASQAEVGEVAETLRSDIPAVAERVSPVDLNGVDPWSPQAVALTLRAAGEAIDALANDIGGWADNSMTLEALNKDLREEQADLVARAMELQEAVRVATEESSSLEALAGERDSAVAGMEVVREGLREATEQLINKEAAMDELSRRLDFARGEKVLTQAMLLALLDRSRAAAKRMSTEMALRSESEELAETYRLALRSAADRLGRAAAGTDSLTGTALAGAVDRDVADTVDDGNALAEQVTGLQGDLASTSAALEATRHLADVLAVFRSGLEDCHADILAGESTGPQRAAIFRAALDDNCRRLRDFIDAALDGRVEKPLSDAESDKNITTAADYADGVRQSLAELMSALADARGDVEDKAAEVRTLGIFRDAVRQMHDDVLAERDDSAPRISEVGLSRSRTLANGSGAKRSPRAGHGPEDLATSVHQELEYALQVRNDLAGALAEKGDLLTALLAREREVAEANAHIEQLQTELRALATDLDDREGAVSRLDGRIASLEEELAEARRDLQSEAGRLAAYRDALHQVADECAKHGVSGGTRSPDASDILNASIDTLSPRSAMTAPWVADELSAGADLRRLLARMEDDMSALEAAKAASDAELARLSRSLAVSNEDVERLQSELDSALATAASLAPFKQIVLQVHAQVDDTDEEAEDEQHEARSIEPRSDSGEEQGAADARRAPRGLHRRGQAIDWSVRPEEAGTVDLVREEVDAKRKLRAEVAALAPYKSFARSLPEVVFPPGEGGEAADGAQAASGGDSAAECEALREMVAAEVAALREELAAALSSREALLDKVAELSPYKEALHGCYDVAAAEVGLPSLDRQASLSPSGDAPVERGHKAFLRGSDYGDKLSLDDSSAISDRGRNRKSVDSPRAAKAVGLVEGIVKEKTDLAEQVAALMPFQALTRDVEVMAAGLTDPIFPVRLDGSGVAAELQAKGPHRECATMRDIIAAEFEASTRLRKELAAALNERDQLYTQNHSLHSKAAEDWMTLESRVREKEASLKALRHQLAVAEESLRSARHAADGFQADRNELSRKVQRLRDVAATEESGRLAAERRLADLTTQLSDTEAQAVRLGLQVREYVEQMDGVERTLAEEREGATRLSAALGSTAREASGALDAAAGRGRMLRAELEEQAAVLEDAGRRVARLQQVKAELEQRVALLEQKLRTAQDNEVEQESLQRRLRTQLADAGSNVERLQAEVEASRAAEAEAAATGRRLESELHSTRSELEDLKRRMQALNARLEEKQKEWQKACEKVKHLEFELSTVSRSLASAEARVSGLEGELEARGRDLREATQRTEVLADDLGSARRSLASAAEEADAASAELVRLRDALTTAEADRDKASAATRKLQSELEEVMRKLKERAAKSWKLESEMTKLQRDSEYTYNQLRSTIDSHTATIKRLEGDLSGAQTAVNEREAAIATLKDEAEELKRQAKKGESELRSTIDSHMATIKRLEGDLSGAQTVAKEREAAITTLKDEAEEMRRQAKKEESELRSTIDSHTATIKRLEGELEFSQADARSKEGSISVLQEQIGTSQRQLTASAVQLEQAMADLRARACEAQAEVSRLEGNLKREVNKSSFLEEELAAANADLRSTKSSLTEQVEEQRRSASRAVADVESLAQQLNEVKSVFTANKEESARQAEQLNYAAEREATLEEVLEGAEKKCATLQSELRDVGVSRRELTTRNEGLTAEVERLRAQLEAADMEMDRMGSQLADARSAVSEGTDELKATSRARAKAQAEADDAAEEVEKLKIRLAEEGRQVEEVRREQTRAVEELRTEVEELQRGGRRALTEMETRNHGLQVEVSRLQAEVSRGEQQLKFASEREAGLQAELEKARRRVHEARSVEERMSSAERNLKAQNGELQEELRRMKDSAVQVKEEQASKEARLAEVKAAKEALEEEVYGLQRSGQQMKLAYERQAADYQRLVEVRDQLEESLAAKQEAVLAGKREASEAATAAQQQRAELTDKVSRMETELREARAAAEGSNRAAADVRSRLNSELEQAAERVREMENALKKGRVESAGAVARLEGQVKQLEADLQARGFERDRLAAQLADLESEVDGLRTEAGVGRREADNSRQQLDDVNAEVLSLLKQRGELEQENASIRLDLETLDEESQLAQATIEELGLKKDSLKADLRAAREKVTELEAQLARDAAAREEAAAAASRATRDHSTAMMSKAALEQELAHTQAKMEASDSDRAYLRDEVARLKRDRDEQKAKLSEAELAGSRAMAKLETANAAAARSESRLKELQAAVSELESERAQLRREAGGLQGAKSTAEAALTAAQRELSSERAANERLSSNVEALESRVSELTGELRKAGREGAEKVAELSEKLRSVEDDNNEMSRRLEESADLRAQVSRLTAKLEDAIADAHRKEAEYDELERELNGSSSRVRALEAELHEMSMGSHDGRMARDAAEAEAASLREALTASRAKAAAEVEEARNDLERITRRLAEAESAAEAAQAEADEGNRRLEEALPRLSELEALVKAKNEALTARQAEAAEATERAAALHEEIQSMSAASGELEAQMAALEENIDALEARLREKEAVEEGLQAQVEHCVAELEQRDRALSEAAETNVKLKAAEGAAISELAAARQRLQAAQAELADAQNQSFHTVSEANGAYNTMVRQANERLAKRDAAIEKLEEELAEAMSELAAARAAVAALQKEKSGVGSQLSSAQAEARRSALASQEAEIRAAAAAAMRSSRETTKEIRVVEASSSDDDDYFERRTSGSSSKQAAVGGDSKVRRPSEASTVKRNESSSTSDEEGDADLRDLWEKMPDLTVPGRHGPGGSAGPGNDLAMLKRRMRAKKNVAVARFHSQNYKDSSEERSQQQSNRAAKLARSMFE